MKFEKLKELVESRENLFLSTMYEVNTNKGYEAILFYLSKVYLIKSKGRNDYGRVEILSEDIESVERVTKIFRVYSYQINFKDGSLLKLSATKYKEEDALLEELDRTINKGEYNKKHHSDSILDEEGNLLALYQGKIRNKDSWLIGSVDVKGWSYREKKLDEMKKAQFQDKKEGSLERATVKAERDNDFDNEAIKVLVADVHIGYIPRHASMKDTLNKLIDTGYGDKIRGYVNYEYSKDDGNMVDVQLFVMEK